MARKRQEKVNSLLQKEISGYLAREGVEGVSGLLTITGVDVSPDLEHAKVYYSVVGQSEDQVLPLLKGEIYELQGLLNRTLRMRKVPRIAFFADRSGEYAQHISQLIHNLGRHDQEQP